MVICNYENQEDSVEPVNSKKQLRMLVRTILEKMSSVMTVVKRNNKFLPKICAILLIAVGVYSFYLGIECGEYSIGYSESDEYYGGDAYTGIQQAAAQGANNTQYLAKITRAGFEAVLKITGLTLCVVGLKQLFQKNDKYELSEVHVYKSD